MKTFLLFLYLIPSIGYSAWMTVYSYYCLNARVMPMCSSIVAISGGAYQWFIYTTQILMIAILIVYAMLIAYFSYGRKKGTSPLSTSFSTLFTGNSISRAMFRNSLVMMIVYMLTWFICTMPVGLGYLTEPDFDLLNIWQGYLVITPHRYQTIFQFTVAIWDALFQFYLFCIICQIA